MLEQLENMLNESMKSGQWQSNAAMKIIVNDYVWYHAVIVIVGGGLLLMFILLSIVFWVKFKKMPAAGRFKWAFEKKVYFSFGLLTVIVVLAMALHVTANASVAFDPSPGVLDLNESFVPPGNSVYRNQLGQTFIEWIKSGSGTIPPFIEQQLQNRIALQTTKAIEFGILLAVCVVLSVLLWSALIKKRRGSGSKWRLNEMLFFVSGIVTVALALFAMEIVLANIQGALAPITLTLLNV